MAYIMNDIFLQRLAQGFESNCFSTTTDSTNRILLYKGTMPTDADNWTIAGSSSDLLATWTTFDHGVSLKTINMSVNPTPTTVTATGTGTATWAAFYSTAFNEDRALLTDVSEDGGGGGLIIDDVNVISGNSVTFVNFLMTFSEV